MSLRARGLRQSARVQPLMAKITNVSSSRKAPVGRKGLQYAMSLHVGQQVVCVSDVFSPCQYWRAVVTAIPVLHGVYTIRHIREAHGLIGLCFHEIVSPHGDFAEGYV